MEGIHSGGLVSANFQVHAICWMIVDDCPNADQIDLRSLSRWSAQSFLLMTRAEVQQKCGTSQDVRVACLKNEVTPKQFPIWERNLLQKSSLINVAQRIEAQIQASFFQESANMATQTR